MTTPAKNDLELLNEFRIGDGKAPFKDWRKARHQPMLDAYMAAAIEEQGEEPEVEEVEEVKVASYKELRNVSNEKSAVAKPVDFVHGFLTANPGLTRKQAVAVLVDMGINFSTARTQYQRWYTANKKAGE